MRGTLFLPPGRLLLTTCGPTDPGDGGSGPVRVDVPRESIDDEAVVLAGGAEEGRREDVALGVAELMGGGVDEVGPGDGLGGRQSARMERTSANECCSIVMGTWPDLFLARSVAGLRAGQGMPPGEAWVSKASSARSAMARMAGEGSARVPAGPPCRRRARWPNRNRPSWQESADLTWRS